MKGLAALAAILVFPGSAAIIDRIAVSVGNRIIALSDIDREIRVTAFLNGVKPDFSPAARRAAADRMVEQMLVRLEIESNRYPPPADADIQGALDDFKKQRFPDDAAYRKALDDDAISDKDMFNEIAWQRTLLTYIDVRFRPSVQVSDQEVEDYFRQTVKPAADMAHPGQPATLENYRSQIEDALAGRKEDDELNRWLEQAKRRHAIVYHPEAFQ